MQIHWYQHSNRSKTMNIMCNECAFNDHRPSLLVHLCCYRKLWGITYALYHSFLQKLLKRNACWRKIDRKMKKKKPKCHLAWILKFCKPTSKKCYIQCFGVKNANVATVTTTTLPVPAQCLHLLFKLQLSSLVATWPKSAYILPYYFSSYHSGWLVTTGLLTLADTL